MGPAVDTAGMATTALISGGARSGKSAFALRWSVSRGERRVFVATAQVFDDEMRQRALDHQAERRDQFRTVECPFSLEDTLRALTDADVVVIDCLTLWLTNLLLAEIPLTEIEQRVVTLANVLRASSYDSIVVSNEVGMGIVPDNALARTFRDLTGRAHQTLATTSSELYFATMGTVLRLRPAPLELVSP